MLGIAICGFLCVFMLAVPLGGAIIYYKTRQAEILRINQMKVRDGRYFAKSFAALVEGKLDEIKENKISLSRPEEFIDADVQKVYPEEVEKVVVARRSDFHIPSQVKVFAKEIYAAKNFRPIKGGAVELRAAFSRGKMILPENTDVVRWVDSDRTLAVYDGCDLGLSASARQRMCIGQGCRFHRLYAPEIYLGQYPDELMDEKKGKDPRIYRMGIQKARWENIRYISNDMINEEGVVDFSVVSGSNLEVLEKLIVNGDIRSHKGVRLYDGSIVCGNIFAEGDVHLGRNACVLGNIFTQGSIYFEEGAVAGQRSRISSVIARKVITFEKNTFVFGYIDCEAGGEILGKKPEEGEEKEKPARKYKYLGNPWEEHYLKFSSLDDYNNVDKQGFRFFREMKDVVIPYGAKRIPDSMFYSCSGLERVEIPDTVEEIGNHAFAECEKLKDISFQRLTHLRKIGTSAFENCKALKSVFLPGALEKIGGAAFSGCTNMERVTFGEDFRIEKLPDHCFRGCSNLKEIDLPKAVREFGISSFLECPFIPQIWMPDEEPKEVEAQGNEK
mgnify:CR=1 FL=1